MRAERKLSTPPGRLEKLTLTHTATMPRTAARLSRHAMRPAPRTSVGWLRLAETPRRTREAEWGMPSETEIGERVSSIVGRVQFQVRGERRARWNCRSVTQPWTQGRQADMTLTVTKWHQRSVSVHTYAVLCPRRATSKDRANTWALTEAHLHGNFFGPFTRSKAECNFGDTDRTTIQRWCKLLIQRLQANWNTTPPRPDGSIATTNSEHSWRIYLRMALCLRSTWHRSDSSEPMARTSTSSEPSVHPTHVPRLRDRNQPDGFNATRWLWSARCHSGVRWPNVACAISKALTRTAPGCGLRNGVRILITFLRVIAVEVIYWIDLSLRSRPTLIDHCWRV